MNLFRSEEHVRNWSEFGEGTDDGILTLAQAVDLMGTARHRDRLSGHYVSTRADVLPAFLERVQKVTNSPPFWER